MTHSVPVEAQVDGLKRAEDRSVVPFTTNKLFFVFGGSQGYGPGLAVLHRRVQMGEAAPGTSATRPWLLLGPPGQRGKGSHQFVDLIPCGAVEPNFLVTVRNAPLTLALRSPLSTHFMLTWQGNRSFFLGEECGGVRDHPPAAHLAVLPLGVRQLELEVGRSGELSGADAFVDLGPKVSGEPVHVQPT